MFKKPTTDPAPSLNTDVVAAVTKALKDLEYDVTQRNSYMDRRDSYLYGEGLFNQIDFEYGQWFAEYNYLLRVIDIHTAQLMGRPFNIYSYYNKEDLSPYADGSQELELARLRNGKAQAAADARKKAVDAIIRDNGGYSRFKDGARIGSAFGVTVYKMWYEKDEKRVKISLLESPQNFRAGWKDGDFRERDFDGYVYQISEDAAYRDHGKILGANESFVTTKYGLPFTLSSPVTRNGGTDRKMVTVQEYTGYLPGYSGSGAKLKKCKRGEETRVNVMIVGGKLAGIIADEAKLPKYYIINNRQEPRAPWGKSDLPQSALDINQEIVQLQADMMTWSNKNLFKLIQAKGFSPENIPKKKPRKMQVVPMALEQSLEEMNVSLGTIDEFQKLINQKMEAFVRVTGVGRVLFEDPSVNANSNQALITTLKPVIDIVEDKQSRWEPALTAMFTDALYLAAEDMKELRESVHTDESWFLCIEWPSVMRREDSAYQQMWLNRFINNTVSLETFLEKMGDGDTSEETDRLKDELKDPIIAAILGKQVGEVAHQAINKMLGIPPWGYITPKLSVKGELSPQEMGNIAHNYQWDQGPYGPAIGPQGYQGTQANENFTNQDFIKQPADGKPDGAQPQYQNPNPQMTPDQNAPGMPSVAGSGMPTPTSSAGAIAKNNQNRGG